MLSVVLLLKTKQLTLFSFLWLSWNIKTYPPRNLKIVNENLLFISCYFSNQLTLYTLDTQIWKNILSSCESTKNIGICKQLKYYQLRIRSEVGISLEIILNGFKCLTVSLFVEILVLGIAPLLMISGSILCELVMLPDFYIVLSPQEEEVHSYSWGDRCKDWTLYLSLY